MDEKMMAQFHAQMYMNFAQMARLCQEMADANYQMFMHHSGAGNMKMQDAIDPGMKSHPMMQGALEHELYNEYH